MATLDIRPSPIAGQWYSDDPTELAQSVDHYLAQARLPELPGEVLAVIAPHAGHVYSGPVAGYAFAAVRGRTPDLVAVISPMHHPYFAPLLTTAHAAYWTPLGILPVNRSALADLQAAAREELGIGLAAVSNDPEHSLEIELPFLQRALAAEFELLPVMVHSLDPQISQGLGNALAKVLRGRNFLLVASTDLSHYYDQNTALRLDRAMLQAFEAFSPQEAFELEQRGKGYACGLGAVTAVLWAARQLGADTVKILHHATSGDVTGDYRAVVGYGAAAVLKTK
ncbi:MAG: AmmeMemoRadiSam system protein B [Anaerolineae bacterium]